MSFEALYPQNFYTPKQISGYAPGGGAGQPAVAKLCHRKDPMVRVKPRVRTFAMADRNPAGATFLRAAIFRLSFTAHVQTKVNRNQTFALPVAPAPAPARLPPDLYNSYQVSGSGPAEG